MKTLSDHEEELMRHTGTEHVRIEIDVSEQLQVRQVRKRERRDVTKTRPNTDRELIEMRL